MSPPLVQAQRADAGRRAAARGRRHALGSCAENQVLHDQNGRRDVLAPGKGEPQEQVRLEVLEELRRHKD